MIELVVCDMAGTTVHDGDAVANAFRSTLAGAGIEANPAEVTRVMGLPKPEAIRILLQAVGRSASEHDIATLHADFVQRMQHHYRTAPSIREVPGAAAAFATLRRAGIRVALNTGFDRAITDVLLERLGWHVPAVIDDVVTSDEVAHGRPHPDMIRLLMKRLGIRDPRNVAKIGDTAVDLEEGANAGCSLVIGVTSGTYSREQLQAHPHTHIVPSIAELPALVLGSSA